MGKRLSELENDTAYLQDYLGSSRRGLSEEKTLYDSLHSTSHHQRVKMLSSRILSSHVYGIGTEEKGGCFASHIAE